MTRVRLTCITMAGNEYVLYQDHDGQATFPHGELADAEPPAEAARRILRQWTKTEAPKLELSDMRATPGELHLLFRAHLTQDPHDATGRAPRMGLPERVGVFSGKEIEESLKTSLSYKLSRM